MKRVLFVLLLGIGACGCSSGDEGLRPKWSR